MFPIPEGWVMGPMGSQEDGKNKHSRNERSTRFCVKREGLQCSVEVTRDFPYRKKDRVSRAQRRARWIKHLHILHRGSCSRARWCGKTRFCAGKPWRRGKGQEGLVVGKERRK